MVINHRASILFCALSVLFFAASTQAAEYNTLSDCRKFYYTGNPEGTITQADAFCKPKMDSIVFCTDQAVLLEQQMAGVPYSKAQLETANSKYKNACIASGGATVSVNVAVTNGPGAGTGGFAPPTNPYGVAPLPILSKSQQDRVAECQGNVDCVARVNTEYPAALALYNQKLQAATQAAQAAQAQQQQQQQQQAQQQQQQPQSNPMEAIGQMLGGMGGGGQQQPQAAAANSSGGDNPFGGNVAESTDAAVAATPASTPAATPAQPGAPTEPVGIVEGLGPPGDDATYNRAAREAANATSREGIQASQEARAKGAEVDPDAEIAKSGDEEVMDLLKELQQTGAQFANQFNSQKFPQTGTAFTIAEFQKHLETYKKEKKTCTESSGKAEKLCVEGTSPGAQAARMVMDAAGPMMLAMNAQKSCNATSKVANLAALGLTAANGVCMAMKMKCEKICKAAEEALTKAKKEIAGGITKGFAADKGTKTPQELAVVEPKAKALADQGTKAIESIIDRHTKPNLSGTAVALKGKCEDKMRNIMGMMANIAALMTAKKSGEDCAKKLAAGGAGASTLSAKQYCEDSANSGSQFCRCQSNSTGEGCAGAIAASLADGVPGNNPNDVAGANIKPNSGVSGFAGGGYNGAGKTGGDYGLGNNKGESAESSPFTAGASTSDAPGQAGVLPALSGSGGQSSGQDAAAKKGKAEDDDKKWGFGAIAAGVSSMFGGGNKGEKGNGDLKNQNTLEGRIERKIASDKFGMEVTPASGISNWDKIHKTVIRVENTLMRGN